MLKAKRTMADKKNPQNEDEAVIEHRVDEMMDPELPNAADQTDDKTVRTNDTALPEIDIFASRTIKPAQPEEKESAAASAAEVITGPLSGQEQQPEDKVVDDPAADAAVDDIVAKEGDELLAKQDEEIAKAFDNHPLTLKERIQAFFAAWWHNKLARYATLTVLVIGMGTAAVIPGSRYFMLNSVGVRAAASLTILDSTNDLPLKNVHVSLGGKAARTNQDGVVRMDGLKLGTQEMTIRQLGFAPVSRAVTLGLGSNPLGEVELKAVGTQFTFKLTDYVSGKPVGNAEVTSGDASAQSDDKGEVVLTVGGIESSRIDVIITAGGYRTEKVSIDTNSTKPTEVVMVTKYKEVFVSKQSGKYDVYKVDIDGKNRKLLLAGTGNERPQIAVLVHPGGDVVAVVSSRDTKRNQDGYLLDTLTLIDIEDGSTLTLEHSERIQLIDWIGDRLTYVKVKAGTSAGNAERTQLMSYDYNTTTRLQLASANAFTGIISAKGSLYYLTANYYSGNTQPQFFKINPDNTAKQSLLTAAQLWNLTRSGYDDLLLTSSPNWYSYRLGESSVKKLSQQPANASESRFYLDAPGGKRALWTDDRDGKGVLLMYDSTTKKDTVITSQSGLTSPLRWLDGRTAVYRVVTSTETASYVISLEDGSTPKKITDMTNTASQSQSYYGY